MDFVPILRLITIDNTLKVLAVLAGVATTVQQIRQFRANSRASIKTDLEVLRMLDKSEAGYTLVKQHVDDLIKRVYTPRKRGFSNGLTIYNQEDFVLGIILLPGFVVWTIYLVRNGFSWWALLTAFFAFAGFGSILNGLDPKNQKKQ